jgi:hypothetical protein
MFQTVVASLSPRGHGWSLRSAMGVVGGVHAVPQAFEEHGVVLEVEVEFVVLAGFVVSGFV